MNHMEINANKLRACVIRYLKDTAKAETKVVLSC